MTRFFKEELSAKGYRVHEVTRSEEVLTAIKDYHPDVVLIYDHFIEGNLDVLTLCRYIRNVFGIRLPILLISFPSNRSAAINLQVEWFDHMGGIEQAINRLQQLFAHL